MSILLSVPLSEWITQTTKFTYKMYDFLLKKWEFNQLIVTLPHYTFYITQQMITISFIIHMKMHSLINTGIYHIHIHYYYYYYYVSIFITLMDLQPIDWITLPLLNVTTNNNKDELQCLFLIQKDVHRYVNKVVCHMKWMNYPKADPYSTTGTGPGVVYVPFFIYRSLQYNGTGTGSKI